MYRAFQNMRSVTKTQTNIRLFLDDPKHVNGDFKKYVSLIIDGTMEVHTQPQAVTTWGDVGPVHVLPWYVDNMPGEGHCALGTIKMTGNPALLTTGIIKQNVSGQPFPAMLEASVFQMFDVPGYGKLHNKSPVIISAVVDAIPPFHAACKCSIALLYDEHNRPRGVAAGRLLTILPSS